MMNCSASIFSTATSAATTSGTVSSASNRISGPAPATSRVAPIAAEANRPTNSLVNRLRSVDALSVPSYGPTAATTGSMASRAAASSSAPCCKPPNDRTPSSAST
ncbi:Uncharacterised protein [Mycobacteroides abscessus subsp. abscessus]|nr:Uncharacterised protein [Mycobacteroides abscessus subsp. abscessus]